MGEPIQISELTGNDFFGYAIIAMMEEIGMEKFGLDKEPRGLLDVEVRINGVPVSVKAFIAGIEKQLDRLVDEKASAKVLASFGDAQQNILSVLTDAEHLLRDKLRDAGLPVGEDRR